MFLLWPQRQLGSQQGCVCLWVDKWISEITSVIPIDLAATFVTMTLKIYFQPLPLSYIILDVSLMSSSIKSSLSQFLPHPTWALARSHSFIKALKSIPTATNLIHPMTCFYLGYCRFLFLFAQSIKPALAQVVVLVIGTSDILSFHWQMRRGVGAMKLPVYYLFTFENLVIFIDSDFLNAA